MSENGGIAHPLPAVPGVHPGTPGMSLRERFAVALASNSYLMQQMTVTLAETIAASEAAVDEQAQYRILSRHLADFAQALTDEAVKRRKQDNAKHLAAGAEAMEGEYVGGSLI